MDTLWIVVLSVIGLLTAVAVLFWAATDFLVALGRYIQLYRDVGHLRDDLIAFAYEVGRIRYASFKHASLKTRAKNEPTEEGNHVRRSVPPARCGPGDDQGELGGLPAAAEAGGNRALNQ